MYQILLVDDDAISRARIRGMLDWAAHGLEIAFEAHNGREAIELMTREHPDLVLTDVNMPVVDGVKLVEYINVYHEHVPVVVLSAYDDFDYVRSCLKSGAADYLLKHDLDGDNLLAVLSAALARRPAMNLRRSRSGDAAEFVSLAVSGWFASPEELESYAQLLPADALPRPFYPIVGIPDDANTVLSRQMLGMMQEVAMQCDCHVFRAAQNRLLLLCPLLHKPWDQQVMLEMLHNASENFARIFDTSFSFGVGDICEDLRGLPDGYQQACKRLFARADAGERGFIACDDLPSEVVQALSIEESRLLKMQLASGDITAFEKTTREVFNRLSPLTPNSDAGRFVYADLVQVLLQGSEAFAVSKQLSFPPASSFADDDALCEWFLTSAMHLVGQEKGRSGYSTYTLGAMDYLRANYSKRISLRNVATHLNLNASYLSRLFREETGDTLTAYLTRLRIDQAEKLLMDSTLSIKEIADQVGISNYSHFFTLFRRMKGITPNEYRQMGD